MVEQLRKYRRKGSINMGFKTTIFHFHLAMQKNRVINMGFKTTIIHFHLAMQKNRVFKTN